MKQQIIASNAPKADAILSQAVVSNGFIFVSGQVHNTVEGKLVEGFPKEKLSQIMQNISAILSEAGATLDDIVKVTIYVTDMGQMPQINEEYPTYFKSFMPAREAICVKELPLGASIEISVIAAK
ncbi:MAG: Endoribonuclease [Candidatus Saccharibacteria bacterium]|nr:Endoribonuclease [Candidatus Saccharibacteria bacterium]